MKVNTTLFKRPRFHYGRGRWNLSFSEDSVLKYSIRTSKGTLHFATWLMLFQGTVAVFTDNHTKPISTECSVIGC
jgi:hypothetical protein